MSAKHFILIALASIGIATVSLAQEQSVKPFQDGDRVVFLGNSITDGGHYHSYIWLYYMTRFPYMNLEIVNAGIGGNTAWDMYDRLDGDVFSHRPTVLTVTFGMNDTGYVEYGQPGADEFGQRRLDECKENYSMIEKRLKNLNDVNIVMIGGSPYDETAQIESTAWVGKDAVMQKVTEFQKQSAEENSWDFVDFGAPMTQIAVREQAKDSSFTLTMGDRVHPDNCGHMIMAYLFLKAQGFSGNKVADICVNASKGSLTRSENCSISNIRKSRNGISFDYLANSLPYPMDTVARSGGHVSQAKADLFVPFTEEMNQELLSVTGLGDGTYNLYIDDTHLGSWTSEQLAEGINMAELTWSPQYQQALSVMYINEWRWEHERYFRDYAWVQFGFMKPQGLLFSNDQKAVESIKTGDNIWAKIHSDTYAHLMLDEVYKARQDQMNMLKERMYEINKPVTHTVSLTKVK